MERLLILLLVIVSLSCTKKVTPLLSVMSNTQRELLFPYQTTTSRVEWYEGTKWIDIDTVPPVSYTTEKLSSGTTGFKLPNPAWIDTRPWVMDSMMYTDSAKVKALVWGGYSVQELDLKLVACFGKTYLLDEPFFPAQPVNFKWVASSKGDLCRYAYFYEPLHKRVKPVYVLHILEITQFKKP